MNFAQQQNSSTRVVGFTIVVLIHMVFVWALASGLARKAYEKVVGPIETKVIEEVKKELPPDELPPPPPLKAPPPPFIPPPEIQITAPVSMAPTITQTTTTPPPKTEIRPAPPVVHAPPPPRPAGPVKAAVACTKMPVPEVPGVNWSGEATFNVKATLKHGKVAFPIEVVSADMRGGRDRKAQRSLISAIEAAMAGYECTGNDIEIQQEFVFRIQ